MRRVKDNIVKINLFQRLIFGNRCRLCTKVIPINKTICSECKPEKHRVLQDELSRRIFTNQSFDNHTCPFYYENCIRTGIHKFKYDGYKRCSEFFAEEMIRVIERDFEDEYPDFITCVPMTKKKKREREYNQCNYLIKHISKAFGYEYTPNLLVKIKDTPSQVTLSGKERLNSLKGAFKANKKYDIKGCTILLCDDVMTTGSTLEECSKALKKAGAKRVICATIATGKDKN